MFEKLFVTVIFYNGRITPPNGLLSKSSIIVVYEGVNYCKRRAYKLLAIVNLDTCSL